MSYEKIEINGEMFFVHKRSLEEGQMIEISLPHQCDNWIIGNMIDLIEFRNNINELILYLEKEKEK